MNVFNKLEIDNCTGCHSCFNCCPVSAINMKYNAQGFLVPIIDEKKCIQCGKCVSCCPVLTAPMKNSGNKYYAAYCKSERQHILSASGGIFGTLASYVVEHDGYVVGAAFDNKMHLKHIIVNNKKDLIKLFGTKYVQSEIGDVYKKIEGLLNEGKKVFFSGTSCQVAGLKSFLQKEYDRLFCMDLICHGVPSPLIWGEYLKELSPKDEIVDMTFRKKNRNNSNWPLMFKCRSGTEITEKYHDNKYIKGFIQNYYLRESCYHCKFKGLNRCSDITIGDFWGLETYDKGFYHQHGTSMVILHSEKGNNLFTSISDRLVYEEVPENIAINIAKTSNVCLFESVPYTKKRELFFKKYQKDGIIRIIERLSRPTVSERIRHIYFRMRIKLSRYVRHGGNLDE